MICFFRLLFLPGTGRPLPLTGVIDMTTLLAGLSGFFEDRFKAILLVLLAFVFLAVVLRPPDQTIFTQEQEVPPTTGEFEPAEIFFTPDCPHCHKAMDFLEKLERRYPDFRFKRYDISRPAARDMIFLRAREHGVPPENLGVPFLVIGGHHMVGFHDERATGSVIEEWVRESLAWGKTGGSSGGLMREQGDEKEKLDLPLLGAVDAYSMSLPVLAVTLGLVDGFNPCAMWVLVYLVSLIAGMRERRRVWLLVGAFLAASGILYFLFMAAWLNVFLVVGYVRPVTVMVGVFALYMGIISIRDFIASGGQLVCEVGDMESRGRTRRQVERIITSPLSWAGFAGIVALAFAVNSVEFICSSAMPAVFTHVLAVSGLRPAAYYMYIGLYVLFFMIDDLVVFTAAALAVDRFAGEKYAGLCRVAGGAIMAGLGVVLVFFPHALR